MCGGSSQTGTTQYNWNDQIAPYWESQLSQGQQLENKPYQPYTGQQVAGFTPDQQAAQQDLSLFTSDPTYGVQDPNQVLNAAQNQEGATVSGDYLNGPGANPYASAQNPYMGQSPAFQSMLDNSNNAITKAYQTGTAADTTRMFNQAGAFGGSAYENAVGQNENALGNQLAMNTANMENTQFGNSANLYQNQIGLANQDYENERGRQIGALAPSQNENAMALDRSGALASSGATQQGLNQQNLSTQYQNYLNQLQYPYQQQQYMTGLLGQAQGGSNITQSNPYSSSTIGSLLGLGLLGGSLYGSA